MKSLAPGTLRELSRFRALYLMFAPIAAYFLLFSYYPFLKGIIMSFQASRLLGPRPFVGFMNYASVVVDPDFLQAVVNSLIIGIADFALYLGVSLLIALGINELSRRFSRKFVQTLVFVPYLFSWAVIGGIWAIVFDPRGIVNVLMTALGAHPVNFLAESGLARPLIISMGVWRSVGYFAVLHTVAILGIDPGLIEAARMDGATRIRQIRAIIIPSLAPTLKVIAVLLAMGVLTHFDEMYVMQNPANKQGIRTLLLYIYETGIIRFQTGTATAGAALVMAGSLLIVALTRKIVRYDEV